MDFTHLEAYLIPQFGILLKKCMRMDMGQVTP
jgi:hypothetical protein